MRSDQVFVLLLIILIPMSGCFENVVDGAEADSTSSEVDEKYYTVHLDPQSSHEHNLSSGKILKVENIYTGINLDTYNGRAVSIECESEAVYTSYVRSGEFIPSMPDRDCQITFDNPQGSQTKVIFVLSLFDASPLS